MKADEEGGIKRCWVHDWGEEMAKQHLAWVALHSAARPTWNQVRLGIVLKSCMLRPERGLYDWTELDGRERSKAGVWDSYPHLACYLVTARPHRLPPVVSDPLSLLTWLKRCPAAPPLPAVPHSYTWREVVVVAGAAGVYDFNNVGCSYSDVVSCATEKEYRIVLGLMLHFGLVLLTLQIFWLLKSDLNLWSTMRRFDEEL
ncbi:hypothetical protein E2C01_037019 [Portunus trituberculatus]|uniref:Uncharacterized protein n=1 Tax=Portunus trituberculatus TaxID=210409 RepID=A0A5B7FE74_PORTR|nr:hypothetical protein [Portunus trituberculatus]